MRGNTRTIVYWPLKSMTIYKCGHGAPFFLCLHPNGSSWCSRIHEGFSCTRRDPHSAFQYPRKCPGSGLGGTQGPEPCHIHPKTNQHESEPHNLVDYARPIVFWSFAGSQITRAAEFQVKRIAEKGPLFRQKEENPGESLESG